MILESFSNLNDSMTLLQSQIFATQYCPIDAKWNWRKATHYLQLID